MRRHSPGGFARVPLQMDRWLGRRGLPELRRAVGAAAGRRRWWKSEGGVDIRCELCL